MGESSEGVSFWIGDGENEGGTFRKNSYFATYEFFKLDPPRNTKLVVLDVHHMGIGEACGTGSLGELQALAIEKFGKEGYICYDIYGSPTDPNLSNDVLKIVEKEQAQGKIARF